MMVDQISLTFYLHCILHRIVMLNCSVLSFTASSVIQSCSAVVKMSVGVCVCMSVNHQMSWNL